MRSDLARVVLVRLGHSVLVLWAAATLIWMILYFMPGDPARLLAGMHADQETIEALREEWKLDRPAVERYFTYVGKLARGDLGQSYRQRRPVVEILGEAFEKTAFLTTAALLVALIAGFLLGVAAAARGGPANALVSAGSLAGVTIPSFWLGLILMLVFSSWLGWFPVSGYGNPLRIFGVLAPDPRNLVLPAVTLAAFPAALIARVTRAAVQEQMQASHVVSAHARGLRRQLVLWRHAVRNALSPVVTLSGLLLATLLGGAVATEVVFSWPGLGSVTYTALGHRDLLIVEGAAVFLTAIFILVNLLVDLAYRFLDPRVRLQER